MWFFYLSVCASNEKPILVRILFIIEIIIFFRSSTFDCYFQEAKYNMYSICEMQNHLNIKINICVSKLNLSNWTIFQCSPPKKYNRTLTDIVIQKRNKIYGWRRKGNVMYVSFVLREWIYIYISHRTKTQCTAVRLFSFRHFLSQNWDYLALYVQQCCRLFQQLMTVFSSPFNGKKHDTNSIPHFFKALFSNQLDIVGVVNNINLNNLNLLVKLLALPRQCDNWMNE